MDHLQAIIKELKALPPESLPRLRRFIRVLRQEKRADAEEVLRRAEKLAREHQDWPQKKLFNHFFKLAESIRQNAMTRGVALEHDEDAAIDS